MAIELVVGERLRSVVCGTEVVVLKGPSTAVELECGGVPMVAVKDAAERGGTPDPQFADGTQIGKRYSNADSTIELLCTKAGDGSLSVGRTPLDIKAAASLPASD